MKVRDLINIIGHRKDETILKIFSFDNKHDAIFWYIGTVKNYNATRCYNETIDHTIKSISIHNNYLTIWINL